VAGAAPGQGQEALDEIRLVFQQLARELGVGVAGDGSRAAPPLQQFLGEARISESTSASGALTVQAAAGSRVGSITLATGSNASINTAASFGPDGPLSLALVRQVEVHGTGTQFSLSLGVSLSN